MLKQSCLRLLCFIAELIAKDYKLSNSQSSTKEDTKAHCWRVIDKISKYCKENAHKCRLMIIWHTKRTSTTGQNQLLTDRECQDWSCLWNLCAPLMVRHWYDLQLQDHKPFCLRNPQHTLHRQGMDMNADAATIDTWPAHYWVMAEQISSGSNAGIQSHFNNLFSQSSQDLALLGTLKFLQRTYTSCGRTDHTWLITKSVKRRQTVHDIQSARTECPFTSLKSIWHNRGSMYHFNTEHHAVKVHSPWS